METTYGEVNMEDIIIFFSRYGKSILIVLIMCVPFIFYYAIFRFVKKEGEKPQKKGRNFRIED